MPKPTKKSNRSFWVVFTIIVILAAIGSFGNLREYWIMNKLDTEGKRVFCPVDSIIKSGSKQEVFTHFIFNGKTYQVSKKVKSPVLPTDMVPVYYLESDPSANRIGVE